MQWTVTETGILDGTFDAPTPEDAARMYVERYPVFDNGIRFVTVNDRRYKVTITRGVVEGVEEMQP